MTCTCGSPDCAATTTEVPSNPIVINVIAEAATVEGTGDKPGYLPGYGVLPAATVTELAKHATLRPVAIPKDLVAQPNYRPSTALTRFIRCRDLTCRWPGCDQPAQSCDIDHTVPYPVGPTHPSNNKPYCRIHCLLSGFHPTQSTTFPPLSLQSTVSSLRSQSRIANGVEEIVGSLRCS